MNAFMLDQIVREPHGSARSLVANPWGHIVAKASDGVGIVYARLDPARIGKVRP
jgi:nitrilase